MYAARIGTRNSQYAPGSGRKPNSSASDEYGSSAPTTQTAMPVTVSGRLALLCTNGNLPVRITCTMRVCDSSDSMNQPVWNRSACAGVLALSTNHSSANVA